MLINIPRLIAGYCLDLFVNADTASAVSTHVPEDTTESAMPGFGY